MKPVSLIPASSIPLNPGKTTTMNMLYGRGNGQTFSYFPTFAVFLSSCFFLLTSLFESHLTAAFSVFPQKICQSRVCLPLQTDSVQKVNLTVRRCSNHLNFQKRLPTQVHFLVDIFSPNFIRKSKYFISTSTNSICRR